MSTDKFFGLDRELAKVEFNKTIAGGYRHGDAEYDSVGVLLLTWKDDDMGCKEKEVDTLAQVFKDTFNFKTEHHEIPSTGSTESLVNTLQAFIRCYDNPSKLGIMYYGGHAERKETEDGVDLELFARRSPLGTAMNSISRTNTSLSNISNFSESPTDITKDTTGAFESHFLKSRPEQPHISFKAIKKQIENAETDMLLIFDTCFAAGAFTGQPFGGRKCEMFCSIAENDWARAPGHEGSFTKILTNTLVKMIKDSPNGFSTSDLYGEIYKQQHSARKPFHFHQSKLDFGRIRLRPCQQKPVTAPTESESRYTIDVRFHLTQSVTIPELNKMVKALQWIPYVQMVKMQSMQSPSDDLSKFIQKAYLANRMRPVLARVRRRLELERARQLCRTNSTPPSPLPRTSERFHVHEPRDVGLFDWSKALAVTPHEERLTSDQFVHSRESSDPKRSDQEKPTRTATHASTERASHGTSGQGARTDAPVSSTVLPERATNVRLSQRALDGLMFFGLGVLAPTIINWALHGSASPFAAL